MKLAEFQLGALNALVGAILPGNKFYAAKLGEVEAFSSLSDFVERVPFTTKEELATDYEAHPPYGTTHTLPLELYNRFHQTSGTRGKPLIWMDDPESWEWILGNWEAVWRGAGVEAGDCALFPFSFGPFLGFWAGFEAAARMGVRAVPGGGMSSEDRLGLLERCGANVLCCTPTYAIRLAEVGEAMGKSVADLGVKTIVVCGEPGGSIPAVRERIEAAWQAKVVDHHGMTEIGPVTVSHEENADWLRVLHFSYHAEVIDPETLAPVELGEVGELVLTTLGRFGAPLLRYRTGDLVKPVAVPGGDPAAFVLEGGIIGRSDDMVVVRGVNIYPSAVDAVVRGCEGIGEYQVEVDQRAALPELLIRVEGGEAEAKGLERALRQAFGLRIPVVGVGAGSLPVFEVKAKRWVGL
ncbi:MAG: AMP-binding protein [Akkermansiaceae bacterium]|nr:AMP-binding protein [Akkermansiaceae bacterium]